MFKPFGKKHRPSFGARGFREEISEQVKKTMGPVKVPAKKFKRF